VDDSGDGNADLWRRVAMLADKYEAVDERMVHKGRRAGDVIEDE